MSHSKKKPAYLLVSARYAPCVGGVESFVGYLAQKLRAQHHEVYVLTCNMCGLDFYSCVDGIHVVRLPSWSLMNGRLPVVKKKEAFVRAYNFLKDKGIDRVLVNTRFYNLSLLGLKLAQKLNAPAVILEHGSAYLTLNNSVLDSALHVYEYGITRLVKRYHPRFAGISSMACKWLKTFGIKTDAVIPNAIEPDAMDEVTKQKLFADLCERHVIDTQKPLVAFVGRLTPEKGVDKLAEVALCMQHVNVVCAGDGALYDELKSQAISNLYLTGNLSKDQVLSLLYNATVFCLPTRSEGFCTALLEACSQGTIPVIPNVGGVTEVLGSHPVWGVVLCDTSVNSLCEGIERALQISQDSKVRVQLQKHTFECCSWEQTLKKLDCAFE